MRINYALTLAIAAPVLDFIYGATKRYWINRMNAFNDVQFDDQTINHFVDRAVIVDSQLRFLGWWVISILGTVINSYASQALLTFLLLTLLVVGALWFYFFNLKFSEIKGWRKYIPIFYRLIGYGVAVVIAVQFPKF